MLKKIINDKGNNIGSLCSYINKRKPLLDELNKNFKNVTHLTLSQKLWHYNNNDFSMQYCICGEPKKWQGFKHGWRETCGNLDCIKKQKIITNIKKYGVDNPLKNENIRNKMKNTMIEKYGVEHPMLSNDIKEKFKTTMIEKYGVEHPMLSDIIKEKSLNTWNNRTFDEKEKTRNKKISSWNNISKDEKNEINNKRKNTNLEKYGVEFIINHKETIMKIKKTLKDKYNVDKSPFENSTIRKKSSITYRKNRIDKLISSLIEKQCDYIEHINNNDSLSYALICNRTNQQFQISYTNLRLRLLNNMEISPFFYKKHGESEMENNLKQFIVNYFNCQTNIKSIIPPYEIDIYIPELKLAFEFNGLYWHDELHKENNYHLNKTELCENQGIQLIHIYEDDWLYKQSIVKSMILNKLGKSSTKIYARKTEVKEITDNKLVREFLDKNHLQGFVGSFVKLGLYHDNKLVSLMIFGKRRIAMGKKKSNDNEYELLRFCSKLNTNVIGGANKLFKYFVRNYNPKEITTYADRSWSNGNLYKQLGFNYIGKTKPNYYYIIDNIKHYRFNFRKDKLIKEGYSKDKTEHQIMLDRKIYRIYDSGNLKFNFLNI